MGIYNLEEIRNLDERREIIEIVNFFLDEIRADNVVRREVRIEEDEMIVGGERIRIPEKIHVVGFGKASGEMALGLERIMGKRIEGGIINTDHKVNLERIKVNITSHPLPDENTVEKSREIVEYVRELGDEDFLIVLVSGGASSLFEIPSIPIEEYRIRVLELLRSGASIEEINRRREEISEVKGGKFLRFIKSRCVSLIISDVLTSPRFVGSGPTYGEGNCRNFVLLDNAGGRMIFADIARRLGYNVVDGGEVRDLVKNEARRIVEKCKDAGDAVVFGGEALVHLRGPAGRGGRCQELALRVSKMIEDETIFLALATDGKDGNSDAAGAIVDRRTIETIRGRGFEPDRILEMHDSYSALSSSGDVIKTGPTGSNIADIYACFRKR